MRLTKDQVQTIKQILKRYFGERSEILLFGSRVDDRARGGDIDLYIEPEIKDAESIVEARLNAMVALQTALGEQKIDLVINRQQNLGLPIYRVAKETGIRL